MEDGVVMEILQGVARNPAVRLAQPVNLVMERGEQWAIVGHNGAGKSLLAGMITGKYPLLYGGEYRARFTSDTIKTIVNSDRFGDASAPYYYQQRWNSQDAETSPVVASQLPEFDASDEYIKQLYTLFHIHCLAKKRLSQLSSGEYRKLQLAKALLSHPSLLVIDNPYIGLDETSRGEMDEMLKQLICFTNIQLILLLSKPTSIPSYITHVIPIDERVCGEKTTLADYNASLLPFPNITLSAVVHDKLMPLACKQHRAAGEVIHMENLCIAYGEATLIRLPSWTVNVGDSWAVTGANGSGKSTLLSLVCADNPQAYSSHISLFGRRRGTGETIWDIKKQIGYVSPEMHRAFLKNLPVASVVASGFDDSVGFYRHIKDEEFAAANFWMELFGILAIKDKSFLQISSGEQRLALLARAFVKMPDLLVLDEPLHGLDEPNTSLVQEIIEHYMRLSGKTLLMVSHFESEFPTCIDHRLHLPV